MVRFKDGVPKGIFYSQHRDGSAYNWDSKHLSMKDERVSYYTEIAPAAHPF